MFQFFSVLAHGFNPFNVTDVGDISGVSSK